MICKIKFTGENRISTDEFKELTKTLGEEPEYNELCRKQDGKIDRFYSWFYTYIPEETEVEENGRKKELVEKVNDMVELTSTQTYIADLKIFLAKHPTIQFSIAGQFQTFENIESETIIQLQNAQTKLHEALKKFSMEIELNSKCNVHVPNLGLLNINKVTYMIDACTEALEEKLKDGWRIVAVCPQPDQRRPDYVLGKVVL